MANTPNAAASPDELFDKALNELQGLGPYVDEVLVYVKTSFHGKKKDQVGKETRMYATEIIRSMSESIETAASSYVQILTEKDVRLKSLELNLKKIHCRCDLLRKERECGLLSKGNCTPEPARHFVECAKASGTGSQTRQETVELDFLYGASFYSTPVFSFHQAAMQAENNGHNKLGAQYPQGGDDNRYEESGRAYDGNFETREEDQLWGHDDYALGESLHDQSEYYDDYNPNEFEYDQEGDALASDSGDDSDYDV